MLLGLGIISVHLQVSHLLLEETGKNPHVDTLVDSYIGTCLMVDGKVQRYMGVSLNGGTPKWLVYTGKPY